MNRIIFNADEADVLKRIDDALAYMARVNAGHSDDEIETDVKEATQIVRSQKPESDTPWIRH